MLSPTSIFRERRTRLAAVAIALLIVAAVVVLIILMPAQRWRHVTIGGADRLLAFYDSLDYKLQPIREDAAEVPRLNVLHIPDDWDKIASEVKRKSGFFRTVLPLILLVNQEIAEERARVLALKDILDSGGELDASQHAWLVELATRYGVDDTNKSELSSMLEVLLRRVDGIPASLALAQAALESGWGRSTFAIQGNALFGQWSFDGQGMKPSEAAKDATYRVAAFDNLLECVEAYMLNLNSQGVYADMRKIRAAQRAQGHTPDGETLASTLVHYSQEGAAYPAKLDAIIRDNQLLPFDEAVLILDGAGIVVVTP